MADVSVIENDGFKFDRKTKFMLDKSAYHSQDVEGMKLGTTIPSRDGKYIYHICIIDYL
jgi:hypothetical protein